MNNFPERGRGWGSLSCYWYCVLSADDSFTKRDGYSVVAIKILLKTVASNILRRYLVLEAEVPP
jgi:hypothetical protein